MGAMRSAQADTLGEGASLEDQVMRVRQWLIVFAGILLVAVPWWLGLLWIVGALG